MSHELFCFCFMDLVVRQLMIPRDLSCDLRVIFQSVAAYVVVDLLAPAHFEQQEASRSNLRYGTRQMHEFVREWATVGSLPNTQETAKSRYTEHFVFLTLTLVTHEPNRTNQNCCNASSTAQTPTRPILLSLHYVRAFGVTARTRFQMN